MKKLLTLSLLLVQGCQHMQPPAPEPTPACPAPAPVEQWLEDRDRLCQLAPETRRARLDAIAAAPEGADDDKIVRLLLASCQPDLMEALNDLPPDKDRDPARTALIRLLSDMARSYRILDERNRELEARLERTIDGIRQIESDMNSLNHKETAQ